MKDANLIRVYEGNSYNKTIVYMSLYSAFSTLNVFDSVVFLVIFTFFNIEVFKLALRK